MEQITSDEPENNFQDGKTNKSLSRNRSHVKSLSFYDDWIYD